MISLTSFLVTHAISLNAGTSDGYLYLDCAYSRTGFEQNGCIALTIDRNLTGYSIEDNGEMFPAPAAVVQKEFYILSSPRLPLAVPRNAYGKKDSWNYRDLTFLKVRKGFSEKILGVSLAVDIINVMKNDKCILTFWYAKDKGVQAITFPSNSADNYGEIFYCSAEPCLFAQPKK